MRPRFIAALAAAFTALGVALTLPAAAAAVDYDCDDFATQAEAQEYLLPGDPYRLDGDDDGVACESNPCPCSTSSSGEAEGPAATPPPPYRLTKRDARRVSRRLVRRVVKRSPRLDSFRLNRCKRRAQQRINCFLVATGVATGEKTTCRFKVAVKARNRQPVGRIAFRRCTSRPIGVLN